MVDKKFGPVTGKREIRRAAREAREEVAHRGDLFNLEDIALRLRGAAISFLVSEKRVELEVAGASAEQVREAIEKSNPSKAQRRYLQGPIED